jgi:hypothetical protein
LAGTLLSLDIAIVACFAQRLQCTIDKQLSVATMWNLMVGNGSQDYNATLQTTPAIRMSQQLIGAAPTPILPRIPFAPRLFYAPAHIILGLALTLGSVARWAVGWRRGWQKSGA